jgi:hypothetical protein
MLPDASVTYVPDRTEVLRTTEAIENAPALAGLMACLAAVACKSPLWMMFASTFGASAVVGGLLRYGVFIIPGLLPLSRLYSRFSGWGLFSLAAIVLAWIALGWLAAVAYIGGRVGAGVLNRSLDYGRSRFYMSAIGSPFTGAETNFFSAFRLHAQSIGISTDISTHDHETAAAEASFVRFVEAHPQLAAMYS